MYNVIWGGYLFGRIFAGEDNCREDFLGRISVGGFLWESLAGKWFFFYNLEVVQAMEPEPSHFFVANDLKKKTRK